MQSREELVERLIEYMARIQSHMRARPASAWTGLDLTMPQAKTLFYLADGRRRMSSIAGRLGVEMPSATRMIDRLVAKGLVERAQDPADRRAVVCSITLAGRDAVEKFWSPPDGQDRVSSRGSQHRGARNRRPCHADHGRRCPQAGVRGPQG